jgi:peptidoglycan/LPS O-acetylase OafA/YrhL
VYTQTKNRDYRADIDGMRAIAIISVFLYHIDSRILPGGYVGVDIFFVISGFLISSHILYEINSSKEFSFKRFYIKRIKRILPALIYMCLIVIAASFFILTSFYFQSLGEQAFSSILSYSNIYFYITSGYFDLDASLKPLLHTWSLGVEEQFYLIWPAVLFSISLFLKNTRSIVVSFALILLLSFTLNYIFIDDQSAIFYLMPFRMFEFSVGAIVAALFTNKTKIVFENRRKAINYISVFALILVVSPMFYLDDNSTFPFYNALPVIIGTGILIYYKNSIVSSCLSFKPLVFIGLISYSLYLYHWPVIVLTKFQYSDLTHIYFYITVIFVSLMLSVLSYNFIEKPYRYSKSIIFSASLPVIIVVTLTTSLFIKEKMITNFHKDKELIGSSIEEVSIERYKLLSSNGCNLSDPKYDKNCNWGAKNQILFFGNSHNIDSYNMFHSLIGENSDYNLIYAPDTYDCQYSYKPDGTVITNVKECQYAATKLSSDNFLLMVDTLVVSFFEIRSRGAGFMPMISEKRKKNPDLKIVMIGGFIGLRPNNCSELVNKYGNLDICNSEKYVTYWGDDEKEWLLKKDFAKEKYLYIDRVALLCGEDKILENCVTRVGNELLFYDGDHFSLEGSRYLGRLVADKYQDKLKEFDITK